MNLFVIWVITAEVSSERVATLDTVQGPGRKHLDREEITEYTTKLLQDFYREWNQKLADLLQNPQLTWGY